jgi:hypothetical protein
MNILIAVEGCEAHRERFEVIDKTWANGHPFIHGNHVATMAYFTGDMLGVPDDYLSLPQKTKAICKEAKNYMYDFMLVCDTDTYLSVPRFLASGFENYDYTGFVQTWLPVPYCSGPSYCLSKKSIQTLVETNWKQFEVKDHATDEDVMVGSVLFHRGIRYHHDDRYVNPAGVLPENDVISYHLTFHHPYTHERMYECHRKATNGSKP